MSNIYLSLPAPAGDGFGTAVDCGALYSSRTLNCDNGVFSGVIVIQGSDDGVNFNDLPGWRFDSGAQVSSPLANVSRFLRVRRFGSDPTALGSPIVTVGAPTADPQLFSAFAVPANDGVGAALDVSALTGTMQFLVTGDTRGGLIIEGSQDAGATYSPIFAIFPGAGNSQVSPVIAQNYSRLRVRRSQSTPGTLPVVQVGIVDISNAGSGSADWALSVCRYFLVSFANGNDANVGYIDAAPGTVFAAATLEALAVKTIEEVQNRIPRQGAGRRTVVLIEGAPNGVAPVEYFRKDGTTRDWIDRSGYAGYSTMVWRASDFTNSVADRLRCGSQVLQAGPNGDGSWTVGAYAAPVITVAAGLLDVSSIEALAGGYIEFTGNVTAALATKGGIIKWARTNATLEVGIGSGSAQTSPAVNDTFFLRRPSVKIASIIGTDFNLVTPATNSGSLNSFNTTAFCGFEFANFSPVVTNQTKQKIVWNGAVAAKCWFDFAINSISGDVASFLNGHYMDEIGTFVETGHFARILDGGSSLGITFNLPNAIAGNNQSPLGNLVALQAGAANAFVDVNNTTPIIQASSGVLSRSAIHGLLNIEGCVGGGSRENTSAVGVGGASGDFDRLLLRLKVAQAGSIAVLQVNNGNHARLGNIIIGTAAAIAANISIAGQGNSILLLNCKQDVDSNATFGMTMRPALGRLGGNVVSVETGNTLAGATADIEFDAALNLSWATAVTDAFCNASRDWLGAINKVKRLTVGTLANVPVLGADPGAPLDGDTWITDIAGTRSFCMRVAGVTYRAVAV